MVRMNMKLFLYKADFKDKTLQMKKILLQTWMIKELKLNYGPLWMK